MFCFFHFFWLVTWHFLFLKFLVAQQKRCVAHARASELAEQKEILRQDSHDVMRKPTHIHSCDTQYAIWQVKV